jgi:hypothetical protein
MTQLANLSMDTPRANNGFEFTANGSAEWDRGSRGLLDVEFRVHLRDDGRLFVTRLVLDAPNQPDEVGASDLRSFPLNELLVMVRQWIATDGAPTGIATQMLRDHDEPHPSERVWATARERIAALLAEPSSRDGGRVGRPPIGDGELRQYAERFIQAHECGDPAPRRTAAEAVGLSEAGAARRAATARLRGWLAPVAGRGARGQGAPGPRLFEAWEAEGYPQWWTSKDDNKGMGQ